MTALVGVIGGMGPAATARFSTLLVERADVRRLTRACSRMPAAPSLRCPATRRTPSQAPSARPSPSRSSP